MSVALQGIDLPLRIAPMERMSLDEFWRFSADNPDLRMELEANGDLILMSPTNGGSGARATSVIGQLYMWSEQNGDGLPLDSSTGCLLPDGSVKSADAAWISKKRWTPPSVRDDAPAPCPDFVIEFRSKSDSLKELQRKMQAWISNGAELGWLIDPLREVVEIYRPNYEPRLLEGISMVEGEGPVAGFVLQLAKVWG